MTTRTKQRRRYKYTEARQFEGDDGYCWAVFKKGEQTPIVSGLTRTELAYKREEIETRLAQRARVEKADKTKTPKFPKFASWRDLRERCERNDADGKARKVVIAGAENLGCMPPLDTWEQAYKALQSYISSLVGEYGESEDEAERNILDEVNFCIDCVD